MRSLPRHSLRPLRAALAAAVASGVAAEAGLGAGRRDRFAFVADRPGRFPVACAVPGHATAGMYLRPVVSADAGAPEFR